MVSSAYLNARKKWIRPQAVIFSNNSNGILDGVPQISGVEREDFIILSDHNRGDISFKTNRLENRKRMVNGHMRSYHIADKMNVSFSYNLLPSRSFNGDPEFNTNGIATDLSLIEYTVDGGAGGAELLDWYEKHYGTFYVFLSYDKFPEFGRDITAYTHLAQYQEVLEMYLTDFTWSVQKRGGSNFDMWNISLTLEEA